jgi:hypothetical protein
MGLYRTELMSKDRENEMKDRALAKTKELWAGRPEDVSHMAVTADELATLLAEFAAREVEQYAGDRDLQDMEDACLGSD